MVDDVIQRGANGFICSLPKVGKSWLAADLALSLVLGLPWVGFNVRRPVKVALITREDNPALTRWRLDRLLAGKDRPKAELTEWLYVNSREQSPEFRLDKAELFVPMIAELKLVKPEFVLLDVFNVLHSADENDNTEMRQILEAAAVIPGGVGALLRREGLYSSLLTYWRRERADGIREALTSPPKCQNGKCPGRGTFLW